LSIVESEGKDEAELVRILSRGQHHHCYSCSSHALQHIRPLRTLQVSKMIALHHRGWTTPMHYWKERHPAASTGCNWCKTHWLQQCSSTAFY